MVEATGASSIVTPLVTPTKTVACPKTDCNKKYTVRASMLAHMRKKHNDMEVVVSPLGTFPPSSSAVTLQFDESDDPVTQGNSHGQVNSPKVVSGATHICGVCEVHFQSKEDVIIHKAEVHTSSDDDVINNEEDEDEHLGEALDDVEATDLGIVAREVERMAFLFKNSEENCHNCEMSKEVELDKERLLKEKDNKIELMKRRQVKTDQKKNEMYQEKKKVIMENVEIKKELKKCQDMLAESQRKVTTLTVEKTTRVSMAESAEEGDRNHHIKCNHCELVFRNQAVIKEHIKINHLTTVSQRCNACNKVFNDNNDLEIHMVDQHSEEADCSLCNAFFKKEEDVMMHSNNCSEVIGLNTCNKCEKNVISKAALKNHMPGCQGKKQREACRNGEFCRYHKANRCLFFHPIKRQNQATSRQHQQPNPDNQNIQPPRRQNRQPSHQKNTQEWTTVQRQHRNPLWTCNFCGQNIFNQEASRCHGSICSARHSQSRNVLPHTRQQLWCQFQDMCNKGLSCDFKHLEGFPKRNQPQHHQ